MDSTINIILIVIAAVLFLAAIVAFAKIPWLGIIMDQLYPYIGIETDVPAGDIGVGGREITYMYDEYKKKSGKDDGALTGKPLSMANPNDPSDKRFVPVDSLSSSHGKATSLWYFIKIECKNKLEKASFLSPSGASASGILPNELRR